MDEEIKALYELQSAMEGIDVGELASKLESREQKIDELQDRCDELEAENDELRSTNLATPANAATQLLENYMGENPSAGEVDRLKERISEILVSEFGISTGVLP